MQKKILSIILALTMVISLFAGIDVASLAMGSYIDIDISDEYSNIYFDIGDEFICYAFSVNGWENISNFVAEIFFEEQECYEIIDVAVVDNSYFSSVSVEQDEEKNWTVSGDVVTAPPVGVNLFAVTVKAIKSTESFDLELNKYVHVSIPLHISADLYDCANDYSCVYIEGVNCPHENQRNFEEIPPTCFVGGHGAGLRCLDCGEWLSNVVFYPAGHKDYNEDSICDNCSESLTYIKLTSDKTEIDPGEEFSVTVSVENTKGLKDGSVSLCQSWKDEYEIVSYEFNENLTFEETDSYYFNFSFDEPVQTDSVDIVTVTYRPLVIAGFTMSFDVNTSDLAMFETYEYISIYTLCSHSNVSDRPEEAPTCTEYGYTAGVQCDDCGEWMSGHEYIDTLGGHVDENDNNLCDVCGCTAFLKVGENIISTAFGNNSFDFVAEQAGLYKIEYSENVSLSGGYYEYFSSWNNLICFSENDSMTFDVNLALYDEETYFIDITLVDNSIEGHSDNNRDGKCDNCSRAGFVEYYVDFELNGSECTLTEGYEKFYLGSRIPSIGGDDGSYPPYEEILMGKYIYIPEELWLYPHYYEYDEEYNKTEYEITGISEGAFVEFGTMKYIVIPRTVRTMGDYAVGYTAKSTDAKIEDFVIYGYKDSAAEKYAEDNGFEFRVLYDYEIVDEEVVITEVCDLFTIQDITSTIEGYPVTTIGEDCFAERKLNSVFLPENITTIKAGAFRNAVIEYIDIYHTLKTVEDGAFEGCEYFNIDYHGTPEHWDAMSIGENNDAFRNAEIFFFGTGHKDFYYKITNSIASIYAVKYDEDNENLVVPATLDGYDVTELNVGYQDYNSEYYPVDYYQITIPSSVTTIQEKSIGYGYDWANDEFGIIPDFKIIGVPGSYAETYANENGITFVAITSEDDTNVPDKPVQDTPDVLEPNADSNITVTDTVASAAPEMSVDAIKNSVANENVQILDKDGKELAKDTLVGTGSKINILDKDGKVLSTYEVMVKSDVDGNGKVTPADARLALRASVGLDTIAGVYETAANYDGKDAVTTSDARMILRKAVGLE